MISNRDPLQGLIDYVNSIKPFHTKIAEIRVQYNHEDLVDIVISEDIRMHIAIDFTDMSSTTLSESLYFSVTKLFQTDTVRIYVADRTSNGGWSVPAWDIDSWSMPVEPFMYINQNIIENVNVPIIELGPKASDVVDSPTVSFQIGEQLSFVGAAQPTLRLYDTVGVVVSETTGAVVSGGNLIGSWDYPMWDIGGYDEDMNVLVNLYGQAFSP